MHSAPERYLETQRDRILDDLYAFLRIPSVSTDPAHRSDIREAAHWVEARLRQAGPLAVEIMETDGHPVVYAEWLGAPDRPTILVYGHYDVQPPDPLEQWLSPPFAPEMRDGRVYARGASDDKGPMFIPIAVAETFFATDGALPVNVKLLFEGEEEIGSPHLDSFVTAHAAQLAATYALSADGAMWRASEPSISVGSRGLVALDLEVRGPRSDLHSGRHGGAVQNPLHALATLVASLHTSDGRVAVAGFYDAAPALSPDERRTIAELGFDDETYRASVGAPALFGEAGYTTLERQWLRPTLDVNGLGGGYQGPGSKTVIPASAHAKISCRLTPGQRPDDILALLRRHIDAHTPAGVEVEVTVHPGSAPAYRIDSAHPGLQVARRVLHEQYGQPPLDVFIGGTLPVAEIFKRTLDIDTVFFSFSTADEDFHAPNEFFRASRLWDGLSAWTRYWQDAGLGNE